MWVDSMYRERMVQEVLKTASYCPNGELTMRTKSEKYGSRLSAFVAIERDGVLCLLWMSKTSPSASGRRRR